MAAIIYISQPVSLEKRQ